MKTKEELREYKRKWNSENKEKLKEYYQKNKKRMMIKSEEIRQNKMDKCKCGKLKQFNAKTCRKCFAKKPFGQLSNAPSTKRLNKLNKESYALERNGVKDA